MNGDLDREVEDLRPILARVLPDGWDRSIRSHDQAALDAAVRQAWLVVYSRAAASVRDRWEAEEIAQEVFCRVLARMGSWPSDEALRRSYLARAARNLLYDQWRHRDQHRVADTVYAKDRSGEPVDLEDEVMHRLEGEALRAAFRTLPSIERQVLRLRIGEGLTAEATAAVVGKSVLAVRQIQFRAVRALRTQLTRSDPGDRR